MRPKTALAVAKVCGLIALGCFLFLPQAGCDNEIYNGLDLVASDDEVGFVQVMGIGVILACVVALFVPDRRIVSALGAVGIVCFLLLLRRLKSGMAAELIEIKYGVYLTGLGLLGLTGVPWLQRQSSPPPEDSA